MAPLGSPVEIRTSEGNLDVVPAVDVPEGPPADVELEVPVGEVGLDARLAEAGHPVNLPRRSSESPLVSRARGELFRGAGLQERKQAKKSLTRAPARGKSISR